MTLTDTAIDNLHRFAMIDDECWEWAGNAYPNGYGRCYTGGAGQALGAHRVAYEAWVGDIPDGFVINHLCENKRCVRPDHLEAVTPRANTHYSDTPARRNAAKTHCPKGHPYSGDNTFYSSSTSRRCRACHNDQRRRQRERLSQGD